MSYLSSSEFVSHGHPDRLADNIAAALIEKIQKKDGFNCHAAIEVFITRDTVVFGGEATTTLKIDEELLRGCVNEAYERSGYVPEMRKYWTLEQVALASDMKIENRIAPQSPDIALGTTDKGKDSGYNDQGVFYSSSDNTNYSRLGLPMKIATDIGDELSNLSLSTIDHEGSPVVLGPDNKVVVTVDVGDDGYTPVNDHAIKAITIAVAHNDVAIEDVRAFVQSKIEDLINNNAVHYKTGLAPDCKWIINGTGKFVVHGASSDTSMTGRKISVNHPSAGPVWCNKMIGGGSLVKPWHASDFILNVACRFIANVVVASGLANYAIVGCGCAIGQKEPQSLFIKSDYEHSEILVNFFRENMKFAPSDLANLFGFWTPSFNFLKVVDYNFFGVPNVHPWDDNLLIKTYAGMLHTYVLEHE